MLDCARRLAPSEALAVADSALRRGDVDAEDLRRRASRLRGKGVSQARLVTARANPLASNPFESVLRWLALDAGLDVLPQVEIRLGDTTMRPDLVDSRRHLVIEADSWEWHAGRDAHARDVTRYTAFTAGRWRVLRFGYDEVMLRPDEVSAVLTSLLRE